MAIPTYAGQGTTAADQIPISVAWPTLHDVNTLGLLLVQTSNQDVTPEPPIGFTACPSSPQGTGTAGAVGTTRLTVYYRRAVIVNGESNVTIGDSGNHQLGQIICFNGVITTGSPFDTSAGTVFASPTTNLIVPGGTTTTNDCLILLMAAHATDGAINQFSGWANADLANITERSDRGTSAQAGGGFVLTQGDKAVAGLFGTTTATVATSSVLGTIMLALKPEPVIAGPGGGAYFFRRRSA